MTTFTVDAIGGGKLVCAAPAEGLFVWREMETGQDLTHIYAHYDSVTRLGWYLGSTCFQWERYPEASAESGLYVYACTSLDYVAVEVAIQRLLLREKMIPFRSGPAVIDFPILSNRTMESVFTRGLGRDLRSKHGPVCGTPEQFKQLYALALRQAELFPYDFHQELPFYQERLLEWFECYERLTS